MSFKTSTRKSSLKKSDLSVIKKTSVVALLSLTPVAPVFAHDGEHGFSFVAWLQHLFLNTDHLLTLLALAGVLIVASIAVRIAFNKVRETAGQTSINSKLERKSLWATQRR